MASLREVKDRIASVRSTLKITSAMKLVASSKLRRAQRSIEALRPYEEALSQILAAASSGYATQDLPPEDYGLRPIPPTAEAAGPSRSHGHGRPWSPEEGPASASPDSASGNKTGDFAPESGFGPAELRSSEGATQGVSGGTPPVPWGCRGIIGEAVHRTVVLAFASNSSMCGAFNANVIKKTLEVVRGCDGTVEVWAFGRKMAEAMRKEGLTAVRDYTSLVAHESFDAMAAVAAELRELYSAGEISCAVLVYNHFVSTGRQEVVVEDYLSASCSFVSPEMTSEDYGLRPIPPTAEAMRRDMQTTDNQLDGYNRLRSLGQSDFVKDLIDSELCITGDYILEPSRGELLEALMPQVLDLKLYAALLDSAAAEHAARMIAMQTATDNAEELLGELTLEYNKGRQQKITSEILDLVGAAQ